MIFIEIEENIKPEEIDDADQSYVVLKDKDFLTKLPPAPYLSWEPKAILQAFRDKGFDPNLPIERVINPNAGLRYRQKLIIVRQ